MNNNTFSADIIFDPSQEYILWHVYDALRRRDPWVKRSPGGVCTIKPRSSEELQKALRAAFQEMVRSAIGQVLFKVQVRAYSGEPKAWNPALSHDEPLSFSMDPQTPDQAQGHLQELQDLIRGLDAQIK